MDLFRVPIRGTEDKIMPYITSYDPHVLLRSSGTPLRGPVLPQKTPNKDKEFKDPLL